MTAGPVDTRQHLDTIARIRERWATAKPVLTFDAAGEPVRINPGDVAFLLDAYDEMRAWAEQARELLAFAALSTSHNISNGTVPAGGWLGDAERLLTACPIADRGSS